MECPSCNRSGKDALPIRGKPSHPGDVYPMQGNVWAWAFCRTCSACVAKLLDLKQNAEPPQQGGTGNRPDAGFFTLARCSLRRAAPPRGSRISDAMQPVQTNPRGSRSLAMPIPFAHSATDALRLIWRDLATASILSTASLERRNKTGIEHDAGRAMSMIVPFTLAGARSDTRRQAENSAMRCRHERPGCPSLLDDAAKSGSAAHR